MSPCSVAEDRVWKDRKYRDLLTRWNGNNLEAALRARDLLWSGVLNPSVQKVTVLRLAARFRVREAPLDERTRDHDLLTIAHLDNPINRGDENGLAFSRYLAERPGSPPGEDGLKLRVTALEQGVIKRRYRYPVDGRYDLRCWSQVEDLAVAIHSRRQRWAVSEVMRGPEGRVEVMDMHDPLTEIRLGAHDSRPASSTGEPALAADFSADLARWTAAAAATLRDGLAAKATDGMPRRFYVLSLLFLAWFVEQCAPGRAEFAASFAARVAEVAELPAVSQESLDTLNNRLAPENWKRLAAEAMSAAGRLQSAVPDADAWSRLHLEAEPRIYEQWRGACVSLRGEGKANTMEAAKTRAQAAGHLDDFYRVVGTPPGGDAGTMGEHFAGFLEGDIDPAPAAEFRLRVDESPSLLRAFHEYVGDRIAWGYEPQPAVAMVREAARVGEGWLKLRLGLLPVALEALVEPIRRARAETGRQPQFQPISLPGEQPPFAGFGLHPETQLDVTRLDTRGVEGETLKARVLDAGCDPAARSAWVTLAFDAVPEGPAVLAARAEESSCRFSLTAEVHHGRATLQVEALPAAIPSLNVRSWYLIDGE